MVSREQWINKRYIIFGRATKTSTLARNSKLFYRLAKMSAIFRTAKIPSEVLSQRNRPIKVRIGQPISVKVQQEQEAQRLADNLMEQMASEVLDMARGIVARPDHELLGKGEFAVREHVMRMGSQALESAVNDRKKNLPRC